MIYNDLLIIGQSYLATLLLQVAVWPLVKKFFIKLPDMGWGLGRTVSILTISLIIWELAYTGLKINTLLGVWVSILFLMLISGVEIIRKGLKSFSIPKEKLRIIFLEEYLFLIGFVGIALVRGFLPNIDSLEKFMDYGFVVRYLNSPSLPAMDMWQAGSSINYYSFGHFWVSVLIRIMGVTPQVGYNLALGFIAGVTLTLSFMVSKLLSEEGHERAEVLGGVIGALLVFLGGNGHTIWYFLKNLSLKDYWYADATRFINNTIHEFPSYSFVVSDLHGHLLDLPVSLLFLIVFLWFVKKRDLFSEIFMGVMMGIMMMTNTWDVPIYGLLLTVWGLGLVVRNPHEIGKLIKSALVMLTVMVMIALPWWIQFVPISSGIKLVQARSPLWQLAVLWGLGVMTCLIGFFNHKDSEYKLANRSLIITAILLVIIPELIYAKDIYPDHPRANTMFKLTYQASIFIFLILGGFMGRTVKSIINKPSVAKSGALLISFVLFLAMMIFPTQSYPAFYDNFKEYKGLDGEAWLKTKSPEKYSVINFLKLNRDGKNMIEAVGDSYSEYNAVSVFSGVPTIEGWRVHEWLWRGGYDIVASREAEVEEVYIGGDIEKTKTIITKYNIGWVYVGLEEEEKYLVNHEKIRGLGQEVWRDGEYYLVRIN